MVGEQEDGTLVVERAAPEDRHEWLKARRSGLGGSDAAAVLGISKWKSPLALWSEKCGLVEQPNLDELEYIEWGNVLEEPIARKYKQVTGRELLDHGRFAIQHHIVHPFMHCTIDREIIQGACPPDNYISIPMNSKGDLSIKNVGAFTASEWEEEPPLPYQVQLQHELAVTGLQWGSFAVLIGGQKFAWLDVPRNERFISHLIEKEEEFWDRVIRGNPPEADASDSTKELLLRLYPKDTGESVELPSDFEEMNERRIALKSSIKEIEIELQGIDNKIKAAIGNATLGILPSGGGFSWKQQYRDSYTVQATDYRVLRVVKAGKGK
jgi:putative phage-type endonuclease